jgi:hypothetical protein
MYGDFYVSNNVDSSGRVGGADPAAGWTHKALSSFSRLRPHNVTDDVLLSVSSE